MVLKFYIKIPFDCQKKRFQLPKSTFSIVKLTVIERKCNVIDRQNSCLGELAIENGIFGIQKSIDDGLPQTCLSLC